MSGTRARRGTRQDLLKQIRQLEERVRAMGTASSPAGGEGLAEGVVAALGRLVPGLEKLIEPASQMPEFHRRLAAIDEEVKRRFQEQPLRRASAGLTGCLGHRQMGIPPSVRRAGNSRSAAGGQGPTADRTTPRGKYRGPRPPEVHLSPQTPEQLPVDVFDEGDRILVLAEAPGLTLQDVTVEAEGAVLQVSIHAPHRQGVQRIELPQAAAGRPEVSLANGVLHIQLRKASQP